MGEKNLIKAFTSCNTLKLIIARSQELFPQQLRFTKNIKSCFSEWCFITQFPWWYIRIIFTSHLNSPLTLTHPEKAARNPNKRLKMQLLSSKPSTISHLSQSLPACKDTQSHNYWKERAKEDRRGRSSRVGKSQKRMTWKLRSNYLWNRSKSTRKINDIDKVMSNTTMTASIHLKKRYRYINIQFNVPILLLL